MTGPVRPESTTVQDPTERRRRFLADSGQRILNQGGTVDDLRYFYDKERVTMPAEYWDALARAYPSKTAQTPAAGQPGASTTYSVPGYAKGIPMAVLDGATFGFSDEAIGSMIGLATGVGMQQGRDEYRAQLKSFRDAHQVAAGVATLAGGLASSIALPQAGFARGMQILKGGKELGTLGRVVAGGLEGGAAGGVAGFGSTEGGVGQRLEGAKTGAAWGGALGAGGTAAAKIAGQAPVALGMLGGAAGSYMGGPMAAAAGVMAGVGAGQAARSMSGKAGETLQKIGTKVPAPYQQKAEQIWARITGRPAEHGSSGARALDGVVQALKQDGLSVQQAEAAMQRFGPQATLMDVGGPHTRAFFYNAAKHLHPEMQKAIDQIDVQNIQQPERVLDAILSGHKIGTANAEEAALALAARREAVVPQLYHAAYQKEFQVTPKIADYLKGYRDRWNEAVEAIAQGTDETARLADKPAAGLPPVRLEQFPNYTPQQRALAKNRGITLPEMPATLPVRVLDTMKRRLDKEVESLSNRDPVQRGVTTGKQAVADADAARDLQGRLSNLLALIDEQVPEYAQARQTAAEIKQETRAIWRGKGGQNTVGDVIQSYGPRFSNRPVGRIQEDVKDLSGTPNALAQYRIGAMADLDALLHAEAKGSNVAASIQAHEDRVRALFPDDEPTANQVWDAIRVQSALRRGTGSLADMASPKASQQFKEAVGEHQVTPGIATMRYAPGSTLLRKIGIEERYTMSHQVSGEAARLLMMPLSDVLSRIKTYQHPYAPVVPRAIGAAAGIGATR